MNAPGQKEKVFRYSVHGYITIRHIEQMRQQDRVPMLGTVFELTVMVLTGVLVYWMMR